MKYWAHSDPADLPPDHPDARWQPLAEHLQNVAALARQLAVLASPSDKHFHDLAERAGLLHDYGKYSTCFQEMIRGKNLKCPHAIHGAAMAYWGSAADPIGLRSPHLAWIETGDSCWLQSLRLVRPRARAWIETMRVSWRCWFGSVALAGAWIAITSMKAIWWAARRLSLS